MGLKKRYELGKAALEAAVKKLKGTGAGKKMTNKQLKQRANQDAFDDARTARKERLVGGRRDARNRKEDAEFAKKTKKQMLEEMAEEEYIYGPTNIKLPNPGMKKGGAVKKRKPTKEELNKIMKTGGGGKRAKEIIENLLAPIKNLPKGVMKTGGVRNVSKLPATQATPATPAIPMKRPRRRTGMTKGIDPTGQPRRLTERERLRMIKQGERYKKRGAVHRMPDGTLMKGAKHGMKHGGSVKGKCKVDGIAIRGRTKAKHK